MSALPILGVHREMDLDVFRSHRGENQSMGKRTGPGLTGEAVAEAAARSQPHGSCDKVALEPAGPGDGWLLQDPAFVIVPATRGINKRLTFPHRHQDPWIKAEHN